MRYPIVVLQIFVLVVFGCSEEPKPSVHLPSKNYHYTNVRINDLQHYKKVYVPIYSDIYHGSDARRFLLTATLSIRNTSLHDTMYVATVNYHDSQGKLQRQYLEQTIFLHPLESVEFVVEHKEDRGGAGASFIVDWGANSAEIQPIIQGVMIGTASQQGISFITEGLVIERSTSKDNIITGE